VFKYPASAAKHNKRMCNVEKALWNCISELRGVTCHV